MLKDGFLPEDDLDRVHDCTVSVFLHLDCPPSHLVHCVEFQALIELVAAVAKEHPSYCSFVLIDKLDRHDLTLSLSAVEGLGLRLGSYPD